MNQLPLVRRKISIKSQGIKSMWFKVVEGDKFRFQRLLNTTLKVCEEVEK